MNERAEWYADSWELVKTSGSDCHHLSQDTFGGIVTDEPLNDIQDYIRLIKTNSLSGILKAEKR